MESSMNTPQILKIFTSRLETKVMIAFCGLFYDELRSYLLRKKKITLQSKSPTTIAIYIYVV